MWAEKTVKGINLRALLEAVTGISFVNKKTDYMFKNKSAVIFGGNGFIGSHLSDRLIASGLSTRSFDRQETHRHHENLQSFKGDFSDRSDVEAALQGMDIVYHLIHATNPARANSEIIADLDRTVKSTIQLLDLCVEKSIKKVIFISSGGTVYGNTIAEQLNETMPTMPISVYGAHKVLIESYLRIYNHIHGLNHYTIRLSNPYGPLQFTPSGVGLISTVVNAIQNDTPISIFGNGNNERDYIYVDDVIDSLMTLASYEGEHRIFNIGSGVGNSINDIISTVESIAGKKAQTINLAPRAFDVAKNVLDITKAKTHLNWTPKTSLMDGIIKTLSYDGSI